MPFPTSNHARTGRFTDIRPIGYGAMLMEGVVGVVAIITAASLSPSDYYAINTAPVTRNISVVARRRRKNNANGRAIAQIANGMPRCEKKSS